MQLLANEDFPGVAVQALREQGHDVAWVRSDAPGSSDREVLARAQSEGRILITLDKDFGRLAFREGLSASRGVVLFRIALTSPARVAERAVIVLESRTDWEGCFSVVDERHVRMAPLPRGAGARPHGEA